MVCNVEGNGELIVCGERHIDFLSVTPDGKPLWLEDVEPILCAALMHGMAMALAESFLPSSLSAHQRVVGQV